MSTEQRGEELGLEGGNYDKKMSRQKLSLTAKYIKYKWIYCSSSFYLWCCLFLLFTNVKTLKENLNLLRVFQMTSISKGNLSKIKAVICQIGFQKCSEQKIEEYIWWITCWLICIPLVLKLQQELFHFKLWTAAFDFEAKACFCTWLVKVNNL